MIYRRSNPRAVTFNLKTDEGENLDAVTLL